MGTSGSGLRARADGGGFARAMRGLDARAKLLLMVVSCVCVLNMGSPVAVAALVAAGVAGVAPARPRPAEAARMLLPFGLGLLVVLAFYTLRLDGTGDLALAGRFGVSTSGLASGLLVVGRFLALALAATLVALTTETDQVAWALSWALRPLGRAGVPVEDAAMALALSLRMIPDAVEQGRRVADAMRARGVDVGAGGPLAAVKSWVPVAIPLVVGLFRRSEAVADAMRARCYRSRGRTVLRRRPWSARDSVVLAAGVCVLVALAVLT